MINWPSAYVGLPARSAGSYGTWPLDHQVTRPLSSLHELAITESVLSQSLAEARKQGATRIRKIKLTVGEGMSIVPDCVRFYFDSIKKGTLAEKARLEIGQVPLKILCKKCRAEVKDMIPVCGCNAGIDIVSGQELNVDYIEIDTPPKPKGPESPKRRAGRGPASR